MTDRRLTATYVLDMCTEVVGYDPVFDMCVSVYTAYGSNEAVVEFTSSHDYGKVAKFRVTVERIGDA